MRIAICEDENTMQEKLKGCITSWMDTRKTQAELQAFESAESFLGAWPDVDFDLAFLDIQMKTMDGMQLAQAIRQSGSRMMLVFVTSFQQYALRGYDVDALHYIIKPASDRKLMPVLDKAYKIWSSKKCDTLPVSDGLGQKHIYLGDINYISMSSHTAEVHAESKVYTLRKTAKELSEELPSQFIRCHRSYIVNLHRVECVYKNTLLLKDETEIPVSRNCWKDVNVAFIKFHMGG